MVDKYIIKAYRKMKEMGLSKKESRKVFYQNTSCIEKFFNMYYNLNDSLDEVSKMKLMKKEDLINKIKETTNLIKERRKLEYSFYGFPGSSNL